MWPSGRADPSTQAADRSFRSHGATNCASEEMLRGTLKGPPGASQADSVLQQKSPLKENPAKRNPRPKENPAKEGGVRRKSQTVDQVADGGGDPVHTRGLHFRIGS